MAEDESSRAYELWRTSAEKFDYFMAGLSAAVLGYIAPTFEPTRLGWNPATLELAAMLAFVGAVLAAFKRIESTVHQQRVGVAKLEKMESVGRLSTALREGIPVADIDTTEFMDAKKIEALLANRKELFAISKKIEKRIVKKAVRWYSVRDYLLIMGFLLLLSARVWTAYL